ncbi:type II toxin-antitoxin system HicA family toxin [bacterium]|nr:type II toxin-antitoxin system HicA family toxin [bacterium]
MKRAELIRRLKKMGWYYARTKGSHEIYDHPNSTRPIPISFHGKEVKERMAANILKQAKDNLLPSNGKNGKDH